MALKLEHQLFPAFRLELKHWLFLGLQPSGLQPATTPSALLGFQLLTYLQILGLSVSITA